MDMNLRSITLRSSAACAIASLSMIAHGEPVILPAGMAIPLTLQHHVNSGYTAAGSNVYFRVADDVIVGEQVLVQKGTLVAGKMEQATNRGMVGKPGMMALEVASVPAVDATPVPVDADVSKQGRSRGAATLGWTIFWGLPGLATRGVNPYMMKGESLLATVSADTPIEPDVDVAAPVPSDIGPAYEITEHRWKGDLANGKKLIDIERTGNLKTVSFKLKMPAGVTDPAGALGSLRLMQVDGVAVPDEVRVLSVSQDSALFDAWSIARYCNDGTTSLLFMGTGPDGKPFHAIRELNVEIKRKKVKG